MSTAEQVLALVQSHLQGDDDKFYAVAMQVAAREARQGHPRLAQAMRDLIDGGKRRLNPDSVLGEVSARSRSSDPVIPVVRPSGDLAGLLSATYADVRLVDMVLPAEIQRRLERILLEQRQEEQLRVHGLDPRRKVLLVGPSGSGKTMTASAIAGELHLPLLTIRLDGIITRFMGESASKLRTVFDAMATTRGVYLFDEFDAIGSRRSASNDVGEIRRVLNSFLQFLEQDRSSSVIVAATNHPELLDLALFRRFDDVIEYQPPDSKIALRLLKSRLATFNTSSVVWKTTVAQAVHLSPADITHAAQESAKAAILAGTTEITTGALLSALKQRRRTRLRRGSTQ